MIRLSLEQSGDLQIDTNGSQGVSKHYLSLIKQRDARFLQNEALLDQEDFKIKFPNPKKCSKALREIYDTFKANSTGEDLVMLHQGVTSNSNILNTFFRIQQEIQEVL